MNRTRLKKLLVVGLLVVFVCAACASQLPDRQSNTVPAAPDPELTDQSSPPRLVIQAGPDNAVNGIAFSPDGKLIPTAGGERTVKLWDAASATELRSFVGHDDSVFAVAFSPNGKLVASGSYDGTVKLWDAATGIEKRLLDAHALGVYAVAFSPDGKIIASGGAEDTRDDQQQPSRNQILECRNGSVTAIGGARKRGSLHCQVAS